MEASDAKRLRVLEAENAKLKWIVADQMLNISSMKELLQNIGKPMAKRRAVGFLMTERGFSERRACPGEAGSPRKGQSGRCSGDRRTLSATNWQTAVGSVHSTSSTITAGSVRARSSMVLPPFHRALRRLRFELR